MSGADARVFLGLGSNLGDRYQNLWEAVGRLSNQPGIAVMRCSGVYESEPWGLISQNDFYNAVIEVRVTSDQLGLFDLAKTVEREMGRLTALRLHPRIIDIDILVFGSSVVETPALVIPHPAMHLRRFVLVPFAEIAPDVHHPVLGSTVGELLAVCPDMGRIKRTGLSLTESEAS